MPHFQESLKYWFTALQGIISHTGMVLIRTVICGEKRPVAMTEQAQRHPGGEADRVEKSSPPPRPSLLLSGVGWGTLALKYTTKRNPPASRDGSKGIGDGIRA